MKRRLQRWLLFAVAVPATAAGLERLSRTLEHRRGPSAVSARLGQAAGLLSQLSPPRRRRRRRPR